MLRKILDRLEASRHRRLVKSCAEFVFCFSRPVLRMLPGRERCPVCNAFLITLHRSVISDQLARSWSLSEDWVAFMDQRDGEICLGCGASLRIRHLALAISQWANPTQGDNDCLRRAVQTLSGQGLHVAEINNCGSIHQFLQMIPGMCYSEYSPDRAGVTKEDLMKLSYPENCFDLAVHSDTLEHVPDVDTALHELFRILKPGGVTIFTVPIIADGRATIRRASAAGETITHHLPPAYHGGSMQTTEQYLVFSEFGTDFIDMVSAIGFSTRVLRHITNPTVMTVVATKP